MVATACTSTTPTATCWNCSLAPTAAAPQTDPTPGVRGREGCSAGLGAGLTDRLHLDRLAAVGYGVAKQCAEPCVALRPRKSAQLPDRDLECRADCDVRRVKQAPAAQPDPGPAAAAFDVADPSACLGQLTLGRGRQLPGRRGTIQATGDHTLRCAQVAPAGVDEVGGE